MREAAEIGIKAEYFSDATLRQPDRDIIALISGKPPNALSSRSARDSSEIVNQLLTNWQLLPSIPTAHMNGVLADALLGKDHIRLKHAWLAVTAFAKAQIVVGRPMLQALEKSGINYSLLKGSATAFLFYPEPHMRAAWDLDIGVAPCDLHRAEEIAHDIGFHPAQQDATSHRFYRADPRFRASIEAKHYELGFLVKRLEVTNLSAETMEAIKADPWTRQYWFDIEDGYWRCYASIDIHHALSLDIAIEDLLTGARTVSVDGLTIRVPDDAWLAAHEIFKLYWEGVHSYRKGLYTYADLVRFAPQLDKIDVFTRLIDILKKHKLLAAGHYVLRRLPLFGVALPKHVLQFITESEPAPVHGDPILLNDLGDMWPKIWGRH